MEYQENISFSSAGSSQTPKVLCQLNQLQDTLPKALKRIALFVLNNASFVISSNLSDIALKSEVGEATVVRLAKTLGFPGFQEFKIELAMEIAGRSKQEADAQILDDTITPDDDAQVVGRKLKNAMDFALEENLQNLDLSVMQQVVATMLKSRRIIMFGMGNSALCCFYLKNKLSRIGFNAVFDVLAHFMYTSASMLGPEDMAIAFSHQGKSAETVKALRIAKNAGAVCVAVTNQLHSPIAQISDFVLFNGNREGYLQGDSIATITSQLHICEILYTMAVNDNPLKAVKTKQITMKALEQAAAEEEELPYHS